MPLRDTREFRKVVAKISGPWDTPAHEAETTGPTEGRCRSGHEDRCPTGGRPPAEGRRHRGDRAGRARGARGGARGDCGGRVRRGVAPATQPARVSIRARGHERGEASIQERISIQGTIEVRSKDREKYALLRRQGFSQTAAAATVGVSRTTAWTWDRADEPVKAERPERPFERTPLSPKTATVRANERRRRRRVGPKWDERDDLGMPEAAIDLDALELGRVDEEQTVPVAIADAAAGVILMHVHPPRDEGTGLPAYVERQMMVESKRPPPGHPLSSGGGIPVGHGSLEGEGLPVQPGAPLSSREAKRRLTRRTSIPLG